MSRYSRSRRESGKWIGFLVGPVIVVGALAALWKGETRFDYSRAAADTTAINSPADAAPSDLISLTGTMDQQLTYSGEYVESFTGYLTVWRQAQNYAWEETTDDDRSTWELRWMSHVESNSQNQGPNQKLTSSRSFRQPDTTESIMCTTVPSKAQKLS